VDFRSAWNHHFRLSTAQEISDGTDRQLDFALVSADVLPRDVRAKLLIAVALAIQY
jgi:hypothetical protein